MAEDKKPEYPAITKALLGNKNALKFNTPQMRAKLFQSYIKHIEEGWSKSSFDLCSREKIDAYIKGFPDEIDPEEIESAFRRGRKVWEERGKGLVTGELGGNATAWFRIMQNQYDYRDRLDVTSKDKEVQGVNLAALTDEQVAAMADILAQGLPQEESA